MPVMTIVDKYKPAVAKHLLLFLAGLAWALVGVMLLSVSFSWLSRVADTNVHPFEVAGVLLALVIHHFGFLKIADKNLDRILALHGKACLFAFIPWKSYLLIAVMIAMGVMLRHSAIPRQYLAVIYISIGLALVLSSVRYLRVFLQQVGKHGG